MKKLTLNVNNISKSSDSIARFIWQQLFNIKRDSINLDDMNSFLIDLIKIQKRIEYSYKYRRVSKMCFYSNECKTGIIDYDGSTDVIIITFNPNSFCVEIEIPEDNG